MSATRLLFRTNKAATGWAALVRRNSTAPALPSRSPFPYCAALARRNGTAPALHSSCATLSRRNGTAPALPFVSPSPYCISFFIGPRHMSSNSRRAFLLDKIALRLQAEGIPYTDALDKNINEFLNENLENVFPSSGSKGETSASEGEMQKEHHVSLLKCENEKLIRDIEKRCIELRYEIDKFRHEIDNVTARQPLDLNLERGRMYDELAKKYAKITDQITKHDRDIHTLQAQRELVNASRSSTSLVDLMLFFSVCGFVLSMMP